MKIIFTRHALKRLTERKITVKQISCALKNPDIRTEEEENLSAIYKKYDSLALKVVYKEENNQIKIITAHWVEKERLKKLQPIIEGVK